VPCRVIPFVKAKAKLTCSSSTCLHDNKYSMFLQVKTHRPEMQKYGGEASGIRAGVIKSVKFK